MTFVLLIVGLALILAGANYLTEGAAGLARRFNVSEFVVGATVIGIGTSAPELVISIGSALRGSGDLAVGNVVGSNLFNTLVILGITALIAPVGLTRNNVRKDIPFGVLASVVLLVCVNDVWLGDAVSNNINRSEGLLMLALFLIFIVYTVFSSSAQAPDTDRAEPARGKRVWVLSLMTVLGLAALIYGGDLFLDNALAISRSYGVSESVIGITLTAGGTSLPELAACIIAALRKSPQLALGNILGSNISNIFLVLGASATIHPLTPTGISTFDYMMVIISALLLFVAAFTFRRRAVTRLEGGLLLAVYIGYLVTLFSRS